MADQQQREPQPLLDNDAEDAFHDCPDDDDSGTRQQTNPMRETAHPEEESPSSQKIPQSKEAGGGGFRKSAEFIGDKATSENLIVPAGDGDKSEREGDEMAQGDENGVRSTSAPVQIPSRQVKAAIRVHEKQNQGKSKTHDGPRHGVAKKSSDDTLDSDQQMTPHRGEMAEAATAFGPPLASQHQVNSPPSYEEDRIMLSRERERNRGTTAGKQSYYKNISDKMLFETRTTFKERVTAEGWNCSKGLDSLLETLKDHKKEEDFYHLGVLTRNVSHHASYGGLYQALKGVNEQRVEAIRAMKHGNVHDSAAKHFIDDLARSQFRVGHLVLYFCDDHHQRADIVRFVAEFHRDCPSCQSLFGRFV